MKKFDKYLQTRLCKEEIDEIKLQARQEYDSLQYLRLQISLQLKEYMEAKNIGFNELARRLDLSPSQLSKIQKGQANITLATFAHLLSIIQKKPKIDFIAIAS